MKTIYIVTAGEYSYYRIVACYSQKAKADEVAERLGRHESPGHVRVEEWAFDEELKIPTEDVWTVDIGLDGEVRMVEPDSLDLDDIPWEPEHHFNETDNILRVWCIANDQEHAIKIAGEQRTEFLLNRKTEGTNK